MKSQSDRNAIDSPRWCDHCQSYGDHHTDRCPVTTVDTARAAAALRATYEPGGSRSFEGQSERE